MKRIGQIWIWFGRIVATCGMAAILIMVGFGIVAKKTGYNQPPPVSQAHFVIQTGSLVYYTPDFTSINGYPAIRHFWVKEGGHYKEYSLKTPLVFNANYGKVDVIQR